MNKETFMATEQVIARWKGIWRDTKKYNWYSANADCAYCQLFNNYEDRALNCLECPVYLKTGHVYCRRTPYKSFINNRRDSGEAKKEYLFLKSLRPKYWWFWKLVYAIEDACQKGYR